MIANKTIADIGTWETDFTSRATVWSPGMHRIFETNPATFQPTREAFLRLVHPDDRAAVEEAFERSIVQVESVKIEYRLEMPDQRIHFVKEHWSWLLDDYGRVLRAIGICEKISDHTQSESALREIFDNVTTFVGLFTRDGIILEVNRLSLERTGLEREDVIGKEHAETYWWNYAPDVQARIREAFRRAANGEIVTGDFRPRIAYGVIIDIFATFAPLRDAGGVISKVLVSAFEITERKRAEEEWHKAARFAQSTIDALSAHVCVLDENGTILATNEAWRRFAEANPPVAKRVDTGDNYLLVCDSSVGAEAADATAFAAGIHAVLDGARAEFTMEYACHSPSEQRWFVGRVTRFPGGGPARVVVAHENITAPKLAEETLRQSEERFRSMFTAAATGIAISTPQGRFLRANAAYCQMLGYTEDELLTRNFASLTHPNDLTLNLKLRDELLAGKRESLVMEKRYLKKSGDIVWVRASVSATHAAGGEITTLIVVAEDISERKATEAALAESQARHRALFDNMREGYVYCRVLYEYGQARDYIYLEVNSAFGPQTGLENVIGKKASEVVPGMHEANPEQLEIYSRVALTGLPERFETYAIPMGIWFSVSVYSDEKQHFIAVFENITARKWNEERVRNSEKLLAEAEALGHIGCWERDLRTGQVTRSAEFCRIMGFRPDENTDGVSDYRKFIYPEDLARFLQVRQAILLGQEVRDWEFRIIHPDLGVRNVQIRIVFGRNEESRPVRIYGTIKDITEQKQAEEALVASEQRYRQLIVALPAAVCTCDAEGRVTLFNDASVKLWGRVPEIGRDLWSGAWRLYAFDGSPLPFGDSPMAVAHREQRSVRGVEIIVERPDGSRAYVLPYVDALRNAAGAFVGTVNMVMDLTERRRGEEELRQSREELRALAQHIECIREEQVARIARELHDELGQSLTMLKLHVRNLQRRLEQYTGEPTTIESREALELIQGTLRNFRDLCAELRPPVLDHLGLGPAIEALAAQFRTSSEISCVVSAADLPAMEIQGQLTAYRIVQELLTNVARHAKASEVRVSLLVNGDTLEIEVADNGRGIRATEATGIRSLGLLGMRERALAAGGSVTIQGRPSGGTSGAARIPIVPLGKTS